MMSSVDFYRRVPKDLTEVSSFKQTHFPNDGVCTPISVEIVPETKRVPSHLLFFSLLLILPCDDIALELELELEMETNKLTNKQTILEFFLTMSFVLSFLLLHCN